ncbi:DUF1365 domain-containing protein [Elongatibacter sediminis]|uniref:DUF1365 domain-containing protein n=1 Tax=Elongatibacter sediminis TaxID=3119006 RepID=A0AAW9REX6_9GAMM
MHSGLYVGSVRHRRLAPHPHRFRYRMFMLYLDLAELPTVFAGSRLFSAGRRAPARFRREDHLGDPNLPLDQAVRDLVQRRTGQRPGGPIRLLTHLRYFGYVFNPVSFYYCFDAADQRVETIVAEVNNTPWGERCCYVLDPAENVGTDQLKRYLPSKRMHVSPFMPMDIDYDWRFDEPGDSLGVHMANFRAGTKLFDATLVLRRREITPGSLARVLAAFPFMTLKIIAAIHWEALRLWLKGNPVYDHPDKADPSRPAPRQSG